MDAAKVAEAIGILVNKHIHNQVPNIRIGIWLGYEASDADLSIVQVGSATYRFVPRLSQVFDDGAHPGTSRVLLIGGQGVPFVILGQIVGNITSASDGSSSPIP